jgi:tetratricopeptide (TPR) repeat protein
MKMHKNLLALDSKLWMVGSIFLLFLGILSFSGSWQACLLLVSAGVIVNPFVFGFLLDKLNLKDRFQFRILLTWVFLIAATLVFRTQETDRVNKVRAIAEAQAVERSQALLHLKADEAKKEKEAVIKDFSDNRSAIISELSQAITDNNLSEAKAILSRYNNVSDLEFFSLQEKYNELEARIEIEKKVGALMGELSLVKVDEYDKAIDIYNLLVQLEPDSDRHKTLLARFKKIKADREEEKRKQLAEQQAKEAREKKVQGQFSSLSGAHRIFERLIKASMNDPDSYEHVETRYIDKGEYVRVFATFRGKNAFGGIIIDTATADFSLSGDLLRVIED